MGPSEILHADVDAFFASVEQRDDPRLRDRPVLVGSWVVMAASYEARATGVRGGMPTRRALSLCPRAVVVEPRFGAYVEASHDVFAIFDRTARIVERGSLEEAFLDLRGRGEHAPPARWVARRLREEVRAQVGVPLSVGIARTRVLAKLASRAAKPDGLHVVEPDDEVAFLHPLPVERVWGIGPATARRLHAHGLRTVGQLAALEEADLVTILGRSTGRYVHGVAQRRELRRVVRRSGRRSFGAQRALRRGRRTPEELDAILGALAARIAGRMTSSGRSGRTVVLRLRFADMGRAARSTTLPHGVAHAEPIHAAARALLVAAGPLVERRGLTLLGVTVTNLDGVGGLQLELPFAPDGPPVPDGAEGSAAGMPHPGP
jgi:DNA polymerase-4